MSSNGNDTRPSRAALEARATAMAHQERAQKRLIDEGQAALRKIRSADRAEAGGEDRITLADLREALQETRQQPQSLPATNPAQVATKAFDDARKSVRRLPPWAQVAVFLLVGAVALAAWLGWLSPPPHVQPPPLPPPVTS